MLQQDHRRRLPRSPGPAPGSGASAARALGLCRDLPDEAWWDEFYTPMETRVAELRGTYAGDPEAADILEQLAAEPEMHRRHSPYYAYEFFVAQR